MSACIAHADDCQDTCGGHLCCKHPGHPDAHMCVCYVRWEVVA